MTAQPIERTPALRRERRHTRPANTAHGATFASLGVPAPLAAALTAAGIDAPFPIQADGYRSLQENQRVEYTAGRGPKGPQAEQVQPL